MNFNITNPEYEKLIQRREFDDKMRNTLLTFSFTAVLAILGLALSINMDSYTAWLCLVPFCLIIPFTARISYYRLESAHINSFFKVFASQKMKYEIGSSIVTENNCRYYPLLKWLVNHENVDCVNSFSQN